MWHRGKLFGVAGLVLVLAAAWSFYVWLLYEVLQTILGLVYWILEVADWQTRFG